MFKNNSVKIKITEQRLKEYVLIFSISFSFGIQVTLQKYIKTQFGRQPQFICIRKTIYFENWRRPKFIL